MALADTAKLIASLDLKGNFAANLNANEKALGSFDTRLSKTEGRAFKAGQQIGTGIKRGAVIAAGAIGFLATNVGIGLKALAELETVTTQTNAVLKSTKGVAGETADSIRNLAQKYEGLNATIDDKVIQSAENVLLTFTNIRKQAFEPALQAALNLSTAMGQDLQSSIVQIGKALNDPVKGLTSLTRVGVAFTDQQKNQIKQLVLSGQTLKAQKIILGELNTEFGGSFLAGGNTTAGKVAKFKDAIEDLQKALATALLPAIGKVADGLSKFLADPAVIKGAEDLGKSIAGLFSDENLAKGGEFLKGAFETAKSAAPIVATAAKTTFGFVQAAVGLFKSLPAPLQGLLVGGFAVNKLTGGLVTNIAGGIIDTVGKQFLQRGGTPANPLFVSDVAGGLGKAGAAGAVPGKLGTVASALGKVFIVGAAVGVFAELKGILTDQGVANRAQGAALSDQGAIFVKSASFDEMTKSLAGIKQLQYDLTYGLTPEAIAYQLDIDGVKDRIDAEAARLQTAIDKYPPLALSEIQAIKDGTRDSVAATKAGSALGAFTAKLMGNLLLTTFQKDFREGLAGLRKAVKPVDIAKFAKEIAAAVKGGAGSAKSTASALKVLKTDLGKTHDPELQSVLRAAIKQLEGKLPGRQKIESLVASARKTAGGTESSAKKLADLKIIEKDLLHRGGVHAAAEVRKLEAVVSASNAMKTRLAARFGENIAATRGVKSAVDRKDLSVTVPVTVNTSVTVRSIGKDFTKYSKYYKTMA